MMKVMQDVLLLGTGEMILLNEGYPIMIGRAIGGVWELYKRTYYLFVKTVIAYYKQVVYTHVDWIHIKEYLKEYLKNIKIIGE